VWSVELFLGMQGTTGYVRFLRFSFSPSCYVCILSFSSSLLFFYLISTSSVLSSLLVVALYFSYSTFFKDIVPAPARALVFSHVFLFYLTIETLSI